MYWLVFMKFGVYNELYALSIDYNDMKTDFIKKLYEEHINCPKCLSPQVIRDFFEELLGTLFPDYGQMTFRNQREFELHWEKLKLQLDQMLYRNSQKEVSDIEKTVSTFFDNLQEIRSRLLEDIKALFMGDPAANSTHEIIRSYPGFFAIASYRIAHELARLGVNTIPRMITEQAHSQTGIDIHPRAQIGSYFCIDHGTGIVIGETSVIGNYVKLYQGVTLGALSVRKEDASKKRHPTLGDHVVVYAGATILGGETTIGAHSIIGGNVWLTKSVPPHSKVYYQANMHHTKSGKIDKIVFKTDE